VKIGYEEGALREKVKAAGGVWSREKKVWLVRGHAVRRLELEGRVVGWVDPASISTDRCRYLFV